MIRIQIAILGDHAHILGASTSGSTSKGQRGILGTAMHGLNSQDENADDNAEVAQIDSILDRSDLLFLSAVFRVQAAHSQ
jgi:hypothetical protein